MPAAPVLDGFALLAFLRCEPGGDKVAALLNKAGERDAPLHMTEVNYARVKYTVLRKDGAARWADVAADFKSRSSFSLADAFAAARAKRHNAELVTGDPEFKAVEKEIRVNWL